MGTRADFYGPDMNWLGSVGMDGYPDGISSEVLRASTEAEYQCALQSYLGSKNYATLPHMGWPWPWTSSSKTTFAYVFREGKVWCTCCGLGWHDPLLLANSDEWPEGGDPIEFPDMSAVQNVSWGKRSGLLVISGNKDGLFVIED